MSSNVDRAECFAFAGPTHLMSSKAIDWNSEEHRRCITSYLVHGTSILERARTKGRVQSAALAPAWWESFPFHLHKELTGSNNAIFGAIYKHVPPAGARHHPSAPRYVVAFRGTIKSKVHDIIHDIKILLNTLANSKRCRRARQAVEELLSINGDTAKNSVWLAGHSLGASLALDVGKNIMVEQGVNLPTFLFNPPHVSSASVLDVLRPTEVAKRNLHAASCYVKAVLGVFLPSHKKRMEEMFERLSQWTPDLYVHENDPICKGYIDYFEQQRQMEGLGSVAMSAVTLSYRDMLHAILSKEEREQPHLLPSVRLWKNSGRESVCRAHELQQWWKKDDELMLCFRLYSYPSAATTN